MPSHEPPAYECPFCMMAAGTPIGIGLITDYVGRTDLAMATVAPVWWPNNPGHALVVPLAHHENLYAVPPEVGHAVFDLVRAVATAMREAYGCQGITVRQNNEPVGNQTVWHYHVHVFPRHPGDDLHRSDPLPYTADPEERRYYAGLLRSGLMSTPTQVNGGRPFIG